MKYKEKVILIKNLKEKIYEKESNISLLKVSNFNYDKENEELKELKLSYDSLCKQEIEDKICMNCDNCIYREDVQFCYLAGKKIPLDVAVKGCECFTDKDFIPC